MWGISASWEVGGRTNQHFHGPVSPSPSLGFGSLHLPTLNSKGYSNSLGGEYMQTLANSTRKHKNKPSTSSPLSSKHQRSPCESWEHLGGAQKSPSDWLMNSSHDSVSQQWKGYPLTAHSRNVILLIIIQENIRGFLFKLCYVINYTVGRTERKLNFTHLEATEMSAGTAPGEGCVCRDSNSC